MTQPSIHGKVVSGSAILAALGDALSRIRQEDRLTWADMGSAIGKSEDTVAKYADGSAEMGAVAFYRAKQAWNGRFTEAADKLIEAARGEQDGQRAQTLILHAALCLSAALEDGKLTVEEVRANRSTLQNARDAIDNQLARLAPKGVCA